MRNTSRRKNIPYTGHRGRKNANISDDNKKI
jgi:hypothetical protein